MSSAFSESQNAISESFGIVNLWKSDLWYLPFFEDLVSGLEFCKQSGVDCAMIFSIYSQSTKCGRLSVVRLKRKHIVPWQLDKFREYAFSARDNAGLSSKNCVRTCGFVAEVCIW